jgi:hypothetical protein
VTTGSYIDSLEWLNKNSLRAYPLKEDTSRFDITGTYPLVDDFFVDMVWVISTNKERRFFLKFLSILGSVVTGTIYDESDIPAATFAVDSATHTRYKKYDLTGIGEYEGSKGKLVIGETDRLIANPQGSFEFDLLGAEFEPATIIPDIRSVSSLSKLGDPGEVFPRLTEHVLIGGGFNTRVRIDEETNLIRIDAIDGVGLGPICDCPDDFGLPECIAFINGIPGDEGFNFNIRGVGCISVTPEANGIAIENTCVDPCCDCEEIEDLEARVTALENP